MFSDAPICASFVEKADHLGLTRPRVFACHFIVDTPSYISQAHAQAFSTLDDRGRGAGRVGEAARYSPERQAARCVVTLSETVQKVRSGGSGHDDRQARKSGLGSHSKGAGAEEQAVRRCGKPSATVLKARGATDQRRGLFGQHAAAPGRTSCMTRASPQQWLRSEE